MRTFEWAIENIVTAHPNLYLEHCAVMAVALMSQQSPSPCEFAVECEGFAPPVLGDETKFFLRVSEKIVQVLSNPLRWSGYVVVSCFSASQRVILWSYHKQEVKENGAS